MLMRSILIAVISSFLLSCGLGSFPKNPDIKNHFYLDLKCEYDVNKLCVKVLSATCFQLEILSFDPYKIGNARLVDMTKCETLGGYVSSDFKKVLNWQGEVNAWAKENKKCFKK